MDTRSCKYCGVEFSKVKNDEGTFDEGTDSETHTINTIGATSMKINKENPVIRFFRKVKMTQFCWEWMDYKRSDGYGRFYVNGKGLLAHRFSYELFKGKIPDGLTIDHLCRNRACVNPGHLEGVDHKTNVLRGVGPTAQNAIKTHCKNGHSFDEKNTLRRKDGGRECLECLHTYRKIWYKKKKIKNLSTELNI